MPKPYDPSGPGAEEAMAPIQPQLVRLQELAHARYRGGLSNDEAREMAQLREEVRAYMARFYVPSLKPVKRESADE